MKSNDDMGEELRREQARLMSEEAVRKKQSLKKPSRDSANKSKVSPELRKKQDDWVGFNLGAKLRRSMDDSSSSEEEAEKPVRSPGIVLGGNRGQEPEWWEKSGLKKSDLPTPNSNVFDPGKVESQWGKDVMDGSFKKKVLGRAEEVWKGLEKVEKSSKRKGNKDSDSIYIIEKCDKLIDELDDWSSSFTEDGSRVKKGKVSDRTEKSGTRRQQKFDAKDELLQQAKDLKLGMQYERMQELRELADEGDWSSQMVEEYRALDAAVLFELASREEEDNLAGGGTSEVFLLKKKGGRDISYAFKPMDSESTAIVGLPKGGGAIREAMSSVVSEELARQTGGLLSFGFPKVTVISIDGRPGALVEGLSGDCIDKTELTNQYSDEKVSLEEVQQQNQEWHDLVEKVTPKELQKTILCNFASCQWDIKWDNLFVQPDGSTRPFDAGAAFPTEETYEEFKETRPGSVLLYNPMMLSEKDANPLPSALAPMDPGLVKGFMSIDTDALLNTMREAEKLMVKQNPDLKKKLDLGAMKRSIDSIIMVQKLLGSKPDMSLKDLVEAYGDILSGGI